MFVSILLLDSNCSFADQKDLTKMDKKCKNYIKPIIFYRLLMAERSRS